MFFKTGAFRRYISFTLTIFFVTSYAVIESFSATYRDDASIREALINKAKEVTSLNINRYEGSANAGDVNSQIILAYALTDVSEVPKDPAKALQYLLMAAQQNNPFAQAVIIYFINAYSIDTVSNKYAFEMALNSAKQNNVFGIINAGSAYMFGNGTEQDLMEAYGLLTKAFELGHPDATNKLCVLKDISYDMGDFTIVQKLDEHRQHSNYGCGTDSLQVPDSNPVVAATPDAVPSKVEKNLLQVTSKGNEESKIAKNNQEHSKPLAKVEQANLAAEAARLAAERTNQERHAQTEREQLAKSKAEQEIAAEANRVVVEKLEQERVAAKLEEETKAKIKQEITAAEANRMAVEKQEQERIAVAKLEEETKARELDEQNRLIALKAKENLKYTEKIQEERISKVATAKPVKELLKVGQTLPDFNIITDSGQAVTSKDYIGEILIIDFFETWCKTCRNNVQSLLELNSKYGKQGLHIFGMTLEKDVELVKKYSTENYMTYPLVHTDEATQMDFGIRSVPVVFVVDINGRVAGVFNIFNSLTFSKIENLVQKLLTEKYRTAKRY